MDNKKFIAAFLDRAGVELNGSRPFDVRVTNPELYKRHLWKPSLVLGEAYTDGWWECDQLDELFFRICRCYRNQSDYDTLFVMWDTLMGAFFNLQTKWRSKQVAELHYNLGNNLYSAMLGPTMSYTCAYWKNATSLDQAQLNKFDLICRKINLKERDIVLELGCGWGSFAKFAAENYGCRVVGVNISKEQILFAKESCTNLPVEFYLCDYRDTKIYNPKNLVFDKVVSIGLCEHIGHKNYRVFMQIALQNLKESGLFFLHTIGKHETYYSVDPWINKYIFPNGMLPSVALLAKSMEQLFIIEDLHNFGTDYDKTLMAWHNNFVRYWPSLKQHYDEAFYRRWNYYLLSCAGGFRARAMQLWQFVLSPHGVLGGYESIR